jgi:hypothetical protein
MRTPLRTERSCRRLAALGSLLFVTCLAAPAQEIIGEPLSGQNVLLLQTDWANLEPGEVRKDLPCTVTPIKPALGFDLRMHSGFEVAVPLRELAGEQDMLTIIFRVVPEAGRGEPTYFAQRIHVPPIEKDAKGEALLEGGFDLGEGKYKIDWLMRDRVESVCSFHWDAESLLSDRDKEVSLALPPGRVAATQIEPFQQEPPVERDYSASPLNVKVLINFAPSKASSAALQPLDRNALLSILRSITRDPRIGRFSIVAFNLQEQRVIFRQEGASRVDYAALAGALNSLNLGTVDLQRLGQKNAEAQFLADLVHQEAEAASGPDALIFASPKAMIGENVPGEALRKIGSLSYPVFYMNYNAQPEINPWRDAIGSIVRFFRGTEYTIARPRDMWAAVGEMVSRIMQIKKERPKVAAGGQ